MAGYVGLAGGMYASIEAKTADYRMTYQDAGKLFTNRGAAGTVVLTLPPTADIVSGWWCEAFVVADQDFTVQSPTADTIVSHNDAAADSVGSATASRRIGNGLRFVWDGTGWLCFQSLAFDELAATALAGAGNFSVAT